MGGDDVEGLPFRPRPLEQLVDGELPDVDIETERTQIGSDDLSVATTERQIARVQHGGSASVRDESTRGAQITRRRIKDRTARSGHGRRQVLIAGNGGERAGDEVPLPRSIRQWDWRHSTAFRRRAFEQKAAGCVPTREERKRIPRVDEVALPAVRAAALAGP